jgi:thiamine-phosphate pyrophosphorylase
MSATVHDPANTNDMAHPDDPACRLYLVSPPQIELRSFYTQLEQALSAGDIGCFQLRLKDVSDDIIQGAAETILPLLNEYGVPLLINDKPGIVAEIGAEGVHIGQQDVSYEEARSILGNDAIIGVTCHASRHMAIIAAEKGADYVAFGSFFPSHTKPSTKQDTDMAGPDLVRWWCDTTIVQCVAIGGLSVDNCGPAVAAGTDFLGVSNAIWAHKDGPAAAIRAFNQTISHTQRENPVI